MKRTSVFFTAPREVSVCEEALPDPAPDQALVKTLVSAISPGTELLIYRAQFPDGLSLDETIPALAKPFEYPLRYGYSAVGQVEAVGAQVPGEWQGRMVFAFQPHTSHFLASPDDLFPVPEGIQPENAIFLPNMETAVNLCMDGAPLVGERVAVFGQGVVGLLTTALLARFPLESLVTLDRYPKRRQASLEAGAQTCLEATFPQAREQLKTLQPGGADLVYELSGSPSALDEAIAAAAYSGRVVIGSWYGNKPATLNLGGRFHRSRIRLVSSQVSSLAPELSGRWTKARRFGVAWEMLRRIQPARWITHRLPVGEAPKAYEILDQTPEEAIQVVFTYS
jgi:2-desacetyl-2-hydroxyethyl bacteriochlorophyllide A dehydrogenase